MKRFPLLLGAALVAATLTACSSGFNISAGYHISFDQNGLVMHAPDKPNAHISRSGNLSIDGKDIAVTPAQRELLQRYYQQARAVMDSGTAMGKQGIAMAKSGIDQAVASIFSQDSSAAEKQLDAQSQKIETAADAMCSGVRALGATEQAIAASLPAFKPYAAGAKMQCRVKRTITVRNADGSTTTTRTSSFVVSSGSDSAAQAPAATATEHSNLPSPAPKASIQP